MTDPNGGPIVKAQPATPATIAAVVSGQAADVPDQPVKIPTATSEVVSAALTGQVGSVKAQPVKEQSATAATIASAAPGQVGPLQPLTGLQHAALWIFAGTGALLCVVLLFVIIQWISAGPAVPPLPSAPTMSPSEPTPGAYATSVANYKVVSGAILDNYKVLNDANTAKATGILDSVVVKIIVPILTLVLGYLFGVRTSGSS